MRRRDWRIDLVLAAAWTLSSWSCDHVFADNARPELNTEILPLLKARCLKCHSPLKAKGKLNLSSARSLARGGAGGPVVAPGNLEESTLWDLVSLDKMPPAPEDPLSTDEKRRLRLWIEQGAKGLPSVPNLGSTEPNADHWAFERAGDPSPPIPSSRCRMRTPIDAFIQKSLEERGLSLGTDAERSTLIRRVTFDVVGLPPSAEEIDAFVNDSAPGAYERLVDRLLSSPHYGERWGKYWLDAMGYSDSNGYFSADTDRPLAFRYRDYIIRALNADKPLDQIVREQLAGDELAAGQSLLGAIPATVDLLIATHYLRNGQDGTGESDGNPDEVRADRYAVLDGAVQILGSSLLGLTLQCAKCHDHKFEPVTQKEYYQLQAILYPAFNLENWQKPNERVTSAGPSDELIRWQAHENLIDTEIEALLRNFAKGPNASKKKSALERVIEAANARRWPNRHQIAWVADVSATPADIPILERGNLMTPGARVGPGVLRFLSDPENPYRIAPPTPNSPSTGRRLALARWLTNPGSRPAALLARNLANRIWQHHFGKGLVTTPDNLGYTGLLPTHPELIEYLAAALVRSGWQAKAVHRLILTSTVYRQSSRPDQQAVHNDPDNALLSRFPLRRLDAEAIRDAMLSVAGELDQRLEGPYVPTNRDGSGEVAVDESTEGAFRRSVYLQARRTQIASMLEVFDAPSIVTTCAFRETSTVPLQSLTLLNSKFIGARALRLATAIEAKCPSLATTERDDSKRIHAVFLRLAGRLPTTHEEAAARRFLQTQALCYLRKTPSQPRVQAFVDFCQTMLASNAFLYVE